MKAKTLLVALVCVAFQTAAQKYFQQHVTYDIEVTLDDQSHTLRGFEKLTYTNNSPDALTFIYFHLWPNAYKNTKTALAKQLLRMGKTDMQFASAEDLGYIDSLDFQVDGASCQWDYDPEHVDICKLTLPRPLAPGQSIEITTPFRVKLPSGKISRLGHIGQSYQITQWYPKPAVYDTAGWHPMPYLTQGEFYSEFGTFDVKITLPENYVVGATGDVQNPAETVWLDQKVQETKAWLEANDPKLSNKDLAFPASSSTFKTLHFHQENVHDFGWFADKRFHVLKGKVALPASGDSVTVLAMFTNKQAHLWQHSIEYLQDAIYYYSLWNGDYPYKHATAVDGTISAGGGMEYPNVTVIGRVGDALTLETVIMHEVGHNWFYGILGSNEREHPWLDEGVNSYNEQRYLATKYPSGAVMQKNRDNKLWRFAGLDAYGIDQTHMLSYLLMARANRDQPLNLPATHYSFINYGCMVYSKSAISLNYLRHYLGDTVMDAAMHRYFEENKFRHPYPNNLRSALETESGQNLGWFFDGMVASRAKVDYGIRKVRQRNGNTEIRLKNRGLNVPVQATLLDNDSAVESFWLQGFERDTTITFLSTGSRVEIDHKRVMPDFIRDNNYAKTRGLLKKTEPVRLKFLGSVEHPWKNQVYYTPIFGMNVPNGFMPGLLIYNHFIPSRKFTYMLAPMFGLKSQTITGTGIISYSINPVNTALETIELSVGGKRYASLGRSFIYNRIYPHATIYFKPKDYGGFADHKASVGSVVTVAESGSVITTNVFNRASYTVGYSHPIYKTAANLLLEQHTDFLRTSAEFTERLNILGKARLTLRYFAGAFVYNNSTLAKYNWRMDGQSAATDYAFDGEFFDRSGADDFLSRQFVANHGGFKAPAPVGQSAVWLTTLNAKMKAAKFPVGVFADGGVYHAGTFIWDAGLYAPIIPEIVEVYVPLFYHKSIATAIKANGLAWQDLIRLQIALERVNLVETIKRISLI